MNNNWESFDESMIYPTGEPPIPYILWLRSGAVNEYKMILWRDAPKDPTQLEGIRWCAEAELTSAMGMWSEKVAQLMDAGRITFDLVFANELIDARTRQFTKP